VETEELHLSDSNEENKDAANIENSQPTEQIQEDSRTEDNYTTQDQEFKDKLEIADKSDDQMEE